MRAPDHEGRAGRAWVIPNKSNVPDHVACLATYLLDIPGAHACWHRWSLSVIHLRPVDGMSRPAYLAFPDATHEIIIAAIEPEWAPNEEDEDLGFVRGVPYMSPLDLVHQFEVRNDGEARRMAELCAQTCVDGRLSPDQDFRRAWRETIDATASHFRSGKHDIQ